MVHFPNLRSLNLENISAGIAPEMFRMLSESPTIQELTINYPLKYESMDLLDLLFERNNVLQKVKITKLKPSHLNFISRLQGNTSLKELHFELFKLNMVHQDSPKHDPSIFHGQQNNVLEELSLKASSYKEYFLFSDYFTSMLMMFTNLKKLSFQCVKF